MLACKHRIDIQHISISINCHITRMYIIKVKGKAKIPDYIQLRDEAFVLIAYFRADRPLKDLHRYGLEGKEVELAAVIAQLEFGKLRPLAI